MTDTFTWVPTGNPQGTTTYRVRTAQFGDGYSQTVADGINSVVDSWPLTFVGKSAFIQPIKAFLDAKAGAESFYWTPPLRGQGLFTCAAPALSPNGGDVYTLTATFQEVFRP